jgi:hypothetical protein
LLCGTFRLSAGDDVDKRRPFHRTDPKRKIDGSFSVLVSVVVSMLFYRFSLLLCKRREEKEKKSLTKAQNYQIFLDAYFFF